MSRKQLNRGAAPGAGSGQARDDTGCSILHVDMDAFFAMVELLDHPALVGRPVVIGGSNRGVVLSATYEARALGVHSAMPVAQARRFAPHAVFLPPHHEKYRAVSDGVMAIFREVTPLVEPLSVDEAFLDVAGSVRRLGSPATIGAAIRARVVDEFGVTCSVGVAPTKFVAKLASSACKPDGLLVVPADGVVEFLHPLPVGALWGVGARTEQVLHGLGLRTVGELAQAPVRALQGALGEAAGAHLAELAWGRDPRRVHPGEQERSIGAEHTFARDVDRPEVVRGELLRLSERVASRARAAGRVGRTVAVKIRLADFTTRTRSRTLREPTDLARDIYAAAVALYDEQGLTRARIRLVGVRLEGLAEEADHPEQLALDAPEVGWREAERAVDRAEARFGSGVIRKARLVGTEPPRAAPTPPERTRPGDHPGARSD